MTFTDALTKDNAIRLFLFLGVVGSQTAQNVALPLALGSGDYSMAVILVYASFVYFVFFSLLDVILDVACHLTGVHQNLRHIQVDDSRLCVVGGLSALNGVGAVYGAAPNRTPLPLQMGILMVANLLSARFKIWSFTITSLPWFGKTGFHKHFWAAWVCFISALCFLLIDRVFVAKTDSGNNLTAYCIFFIVGSFFAMMYNVQQDQVMATARHEGSLEHPLSNLCFFKHAVSLLRRQLAWMFMIIWIGALIAMIPGADQSGVLTKKTFENSWAAFLPFGDPYMNTFNLGYILCFIFSVFLNKIDSALTLTAVNVSGVCAIAIGWVPSIGMKVVGYHPNIPLTVAAIICALIGMYPSEMYSRVLRKETQRHFDNQNGDMCVPLVNEADDCDCDA